MNWGKYRTEGLTAAMAVAVCVSFPGLARAQGGLRPYGAPVYMAQRPVQATRPPQARPGHAGDWLRRYKDLPPAEQERALQHDRDFRRLSPAQQQLLVQRLRRFSSLPPDQQARVLNRMETWEHLTQMQKQQARQIFHQLQVLPPNRQVMVTGALRNLRGLTPEQQQGVIDSERFRNMFSPQERDLMRGATQLPLAPAEP
jgi:Protein of unknown function (DUF3106)